VLSLRTFHLVFIASAAVLACGVAAAALRGFFDARDARSLAAGLFAGAAALGLAAYGAWFWKKMRGTGG
jgi:hypothetical protein